MNLDLHVDWHCPSCGLTDRTRPLPNRFHPCPRLGGLNTPLLRAGVAGKHEVVMRQDDVGDEKVQTDDAGRPVMAINTIRDDGQDATVFAPTATARWSDGTY